jgi:hypothetical protein
MQSLKISCMFVTTLLDAQLTIASYFVHGNYAGLSVFVNRASVESERGAIMVAVGILVPLSEGRLGRGWQHAQSLRSLATTISKDIHHSEQLESYWQAHSLEHISIVESPTEVSRSEHSTKHATSSKSLETDSYLLNDTPSTVPLPHTLSPDHPALSLINYLDLFGPLAFPIYRAALLRERILILGQAPVEQACKFGKLATHLRFFSLT